MASTNLDASIISIVVRHPSTFADVRRTGISASDFGEEYNPVWRYITRAKKRHDSLPSLDHLEERYPDLYFPKAKKRDLALLIEQMKQRRKWRRFLDIIEEAATAGGTPDEVDEAIQQLQGDVNHLISASSNGDGHLIDLFSEEGAKRMFRDIRKRRAGAELGIPTGLKRFDAITGGLVRRRMVVIIGRPGLGKSWLDLLFVANAVLHGQKVGLYPLEMTLEETALRLYTIFSLKMFGVKKVLRNMDLMHGRVRKKDLVRFLHVLEDKFAGQLYVADVGSLGDPYTVERIEAENELYNFDLFWIDYITLMKAPVGSGAREDKEYLAISRLSKGVKGIAQRQNTVGGCSAQVNREAMLRRMLIPRLEHIAYGDAIGQDADQVVSINRRGDHLFYGCVKNRHGPEVPTTRAKFAVDVGIIEDTEDQPQEDED